MTKHRQDKIPLHRALQDTGRHEYGNTQDTYTRVASLFHDATPDKHVASVAQHTHLYPNEVAFVQCTLIPRGGSKTDKTPTLDTQDMRRHMSVCVPCNTVKQDMFRTSVL